MNKINKKNKINNNILLNCYIVIWLYGYMVIWLDRWLIFHLLNITIFF